MKKILLCFCFGTFLLSCNSDKEKTETPAAADKPAETTAAPTDLPYKASYSSSWTTDVPDADLKTALMSYKYWADANMSGLESTLADSVWVDFAGGDHFGGTKADLMKKWATYRDSLSSVSIDMEGWQKMYATDKKDGFIVTWYKEIDTYKSGKADSAYYHDINQMKNGKIVWYSQYKRPAKK
jgi:ketosteroid isomerase-like protein